MLYELLMLTIIGHVTQPTIHNYGIYATPGGCLEAAEVYDRKMNSLPHVKAAGSYVVFTCVEFIQPKEV